VLPSDDEIAGKALELAGSALVDLKRSVGDSVVVEDLRQAWNRLLQLEGRDEASAVEQLSPAGRVASELLLAALEAFPEQDHPKAPSVVGAGIAPPARSEQSGLLDEAERLVESVALAQDALVAAQGEVAHLEPELHAAKVRFGNAIRRLYQAGASVGTISPTRWE